MKVGTKGEATAMEMKNHRASIGTVKSVPHVDLYKMPAGQKVSGNPKGHKVIGGEQV